MVSPFPAFLPSSAVYVPGSTMKFGDSSRPSFSPGHGAKEDAAW